MALAAVIASATLCGSALSLTLSETGTAKYSIVVDDTASAPVRKAATELQTYLGQVTGAKFEIVPASSDVRLEKAIYVGPSKAASTLLPDVKWPELKADEIIIATKQDNLILAGGEPRGTLYAVYQFLEDVVGCEWWTSNVSTIPKNPTLEIPELDIRYTPPFIYRDAYFTDISGNPEFAAKLKRNGKADDKGNPPELGGSLWFLGWVHTFDKFLPATALFPKHPEWGAQVNGKRITWEQTKGQLCLTNEEMRKEMLRVVREKLAKQPDTKIVSISHNDNTNRCKCEKCLAIEAEEDSSSGPLIRFVNSIARDLKADYPDLLVETLAYFYTVKPPAKTVPDDNVLIRLCPYTEDYSLPFTDERNPKFRSYLEGWNAISKQLFVWDYTPDFNDSWKLRPNIFRQAENLRLYKKNNVVGVFSQGPTKAQASDFLGLRAWLIQHLLWNPDADDDALVKRYLDGYYGQAGAHLYRYLRLMDDEGKKIDLIMSGNGASQLPYTGKTLSEASRIFDEAEESVKSDATLLKRVKIERLALDYLTLLRYPELRKTGEPHPFKNDQEALAACDAFLKNTQDLGLDQTVNRGAWGATDKVVEVLKTRCLPAGPLPELAKDKSVLTFPAAELNLWGYGSRTFLEPDKTASQNNSARVPHTSNLPVVSKDIPASMAGRDWVVYAVVRNGGDQKSKITLGVNQHQTETPILKKTVTLAPGGEYQTVMIGKGRFEPLDYFYLSPADSPQKADTHIDRVYFVER